ncbi:hypothetical protein COV12_01120 [Candidatus Woesearchaeota archaeon CG10_big_fil_rev_8_21_14_0_10_32_24]|nr:MAG: hypothetical protein COV12_01120 [Candidatus Woesearchaeota archaeon CG10_big_fil_rev_8_21_14_0_10_32_24]
MANEKNSFKLFIYGVLILVLFLAFIQLFIHGTGLFFTLELVGFLVLGIFTFLGFVGYKSGWGNNFFFFIFLAYLGNLILIWYFNDALYVTLGLLAVIGFLLAFPRKHESKNKPIPHKEESHSMVFDAVESETKSSPVKKVSTPKFQVKHSPGKYVASSRSNIYHAPKCDWAKKIKLERQTWFAKKEDAWELGYKAHNCVE